MVRKEVLSQLIDSKKAAILRVVLNSSEEMYLKEIATKSNVPITSTFRILQELTVMEILTKRHWKTSKVYVCNQNEKAAFLKDLFAEPFDGLQTFVDAIEAVPGIESVILHGARKKGKANVLLLGENINRAKIDPLCEDLKGKGFELSYLTLTKDQYEQMAKMGLYSGEKQVLKERKP